MLRGLPLEINRESSSNAIQEGKEGALVEVRAAHEVAAASADELALMVF